MNSAASRPQAAEEFALPHSGVMVISALGETVSTVWDTLEHKAAPLSVPAAGDPVRHHRVSSKPAPWLRPHILQRLSKPCFQAPLASPSSGHR